MVELVGVPSVFVVEELASIGIAPSMEVFMQVARVPFGTQIEPEEGLEFRELCVVERNVRAGDAGEKLAGIPVTPAG